MQQIIRGTNRVSPPTGGSRDTFARSTTRTIDAIGVADGNAVRECRQSHHRARCHFELPSSSSSSGRVNRFRPAVPTEVHRFPMIREEGIPSPPLPPEGPKNRRDRAAFFLAVLSSFRYVPSRSASARTNQPLSRVEEEARSWRVRTIIRIVQLAAVIATDQVSGILSL